MGINVVMPQMGEAVLEGTVTKWLKKIGDRVVRDESLFEVSTDKVDTEIPAPDDGVLREILVQEGATVKVGTVVAVLESPGESAGERATEIGKVNEPPAAAPAEIVPAEAAESPATTSAAPESAHPAPAPAETGVAAPAVEEAPAFVRTSPLVRRIARERGVDLSRIRGTGLSGRLRMEDLEAHLGQEDKAKAPVSEVPKAVPPALSVASVERRPASELSSAVQGTAPRIPGDYEIVPMTPMRKAIAEHMVASRRTSAHVQTVFEVDMTSIVHLREKQSDEFEARTGIGLTYTPFFAKALVETIAKFPILSSSVSDDKIIYKNSVNLGVAVALESGLIVPVVMNAHTKSFSGLALAIHDLAKRARTKKLKPEEVQNGTITLTNPGIFGSLMGTPIINQPQVAILCAGTLEKRPVIVNDAIAIRTMVYLVLSFDHRIIDGAIADQAMALVKSKLQSWNTWRE